MEVRMDGRVALITGGSAGLGKAMAARFAECGAQVVMLARRADVLEATKAEIQAAGGVAFGYVCDVSNKAEIEKTCAAVATEVGPVDILINNAGTSRAMPFQDASDEIWQDDLDLKLFAAIRLSRLLMPSMKERRWGRIINVLNIGAKAPGAASAPTSVSRAAGMALTKVLANDGAPHNVLVNAMLVGFINSEQWTKRFDGLNDDSSYQDYLDGIVKQRRIPLGRVGEASEFAAMAALLCSDVCGYVTGTAINVDGGASPVL